MPAPALVLASTSPYRRMLLERLGLAFTTTAPDVDEVPLAGEQPADRALRLARQKAAAVATRHPGAIVIGSDQVASLGGSGTATLLRKPGHRAACRAQLESMAGGLVQFHTAVAVRLAAAELWHVDETRVQFRPLTAAEIERYMDLEPAFDCAGGFKCEGLGVSLCQSIETRDPTALVGLPLIWLAAALRQLGAAP